MAALTRVPPQGWQAVQRALLPLICRGMSRSSGSSFRNLKPKPGTAAPRPSQGPKKGAEAGGKPPKGDGKKGDGKGFSFSLGLPEIFGGLVCMMALSTFVAPGNGDGAVETIDFQFFRNELLAKDMVDKVRVQGLALGWR